LQVVVHEGAIREKPSSVAEARRFIASYADSPGSTVGSCVCTCLDSGKRSELIEVNMVHMAPIPCDAVEQLIEEGTIFHCAGGAASHVISMPCVLA
jgi:septum formation protein